MADEPPKEPGKKLADILREGAADVPRRRVRRKKPEDTVAMHQLAAKLVAARERKRQLEEEQITAAADWLEAKWGFGRKCPYCASPTWSVGPPSVFRLSDGAESIPLFPVSCTNCGQTVLVDAQQAGIPGYDEGGER